MAYKREDGLGPFPCNAGEFCGNHVRGERPVCLFDETPQHAAEHQRRYLAMMRFGRPSKCEAGTSDEMAAQGFVGLYLKEDSPVRSDETPVETDELTEERVTTDGSPELRQM